MFDYKALCATIQTQSALFDIDQFMIRYQISEMIQFFTDIAGEDEIAPFDSTYTFAMCVGDHTQSDTSYSDIEQIIISEYLNEFNTLNEKIKAMQPQGEMF